jgi:Spy/CpxP family protein refolding chaperone
MNTRIRALLVLIAVFLLGGTAGFFVRGLTKPNAPENSRWRREGPQLEKELSLTPEQEAKFKEIMSPSGELGQQFQKLRAEQHEKMDKIDQEVRPRYDAIWAEMGPRFEALRNETNRRIMNILNEEQKKKFAEFVKESEKWHHHGRSQEPEGRSRK